MDDLRLFGHYYSEKNRDLGGLLWIAIYRPPKSQNMTGWKITFFLIGDTSSNGWFSIVISYSGDAHLIVTTKCTPPTWTLDTHKSSFIAKGSDEQCGASKIPRKIPPHPSGFNQHILEEEFWKHRNMAEIVEIYWFPQA